ncbi:MAG: hypothetical protein QM528_05700 [Phycisphaerales bacterium]|nr:hypothetical protein [Phycisphaerales bacterium]
MSELEKLYQLNRKNYEKLKSKTPNEIVHDDNEQLYYQIREMFNNLVEKNIQPLYFIFLLTKQPIQV